MKKRYLLLLSIVLCMSIPALADDTEIYGVSTIDVPPNVLIIFDNSGSMSGSVGGQVKMITAKEVVAKLIHDNIDPDGDGEENIRFGLMKFNTHDTNDESGYILGECGASQNFLIGSYTPPTNGTVFTDSDQSATYGAIGGMESETWTPLAETTAEAGLYFAGEYSWFNGTDTDSTNYPLGRYDAECADNDNTTGCQNYSGDSPIQYRCQKNYIIIITDGEPTHDNHKFTENDYVDDDELTDTGNTNFLDDVTDFLANNDLRDDLGSTGDFESQTVTTYTIGFATNQALLLSTATRGDGEYYTATNADELGEALNAIITSIKDDNVSFSAASVPVSRANKTYAGNSVYYGLFKPVVDDNWLGNIKKYGITDLGVIQGKNGNNAVTPDGVIKDNAKSYWLASGADPDGPHVDKGGAGAKLLSDIAAAAVNGNTFRKIYTYTEQKDTDENKIKNLTDPVNAFTIANTLLDDDFFGLSDTATVTREQIITAVRHEDGTWPLASFLHSQPLVVHYNLDDDDASNDKSMIFAGSNGGMLHAFKEADGQEKWAYVPPDLSTNLKNLVDPTTLQYFVDGGLTLYTYDHDDDSTTADRKLLIFGERRGGDRYTTLNISAFNTPKWKYTVKRNRLRYTDNNVKVGEFLGQSWFTPQIATMGYTENSTYFTKDVLLLTGGYDTNQDSLTPTTSDTEGRAVFAVDAQGGQLFSNFNFSADNYSAMTHSIIALNGFENPKSRTTTRVYAGDMNGNLFGFRDDIYHHNLDSTVTTFAGLYDGKEDGVWDQKIRLYQSPGKKIFYAPNILNEYFPVNITQADSTTAVEQRVGDYVFYGTGDRAHPERTDIENRFYAIKNSWDWGGSSTPTLIEAYVYVNGPNGVEIRNKSNDAVLGTGDLFILDVTDDLYQNTETDSDTRELYANYVTNAIDHQNNRGWFIRLVNNDTGNTEGEKMVSTPIIFGGVIYFTTYVPAPTDTNANQDKCADPGAQGSGYLYAIGYKYGGAMLNFYEADSGLHRKDRSKRLKVPGIPPQPVLVMHEGKPTIITGFETTDPLFTPGLNRFYWRQIYR